MDSEALVKEARAWPGVEWDALSAGKVGELLDNMASTIEALRVENARLQSEIDRLRGPVLTYEKGYGLGDGDAALQETE